MIDMGIFKRIFGQNSPELEKELSNIWECFFTWLPFHIMGKALIPDSQLTTEQKEVLESIYIFGVFTQIYTDAKTLEASQLDGHLKETVRNVFIDKDSQLDFGFSISKFNEVYDFIYEEVLQDKDLRKILLYSGKYYEKWLILYMNDRIIKKTKLLDNTETNKYGMGLNLIYMDEDLMNKISPKLSFSYKRSKQS